MEYIYQNIKSCYIFDNNEQIPVKSINWFLKEKAQKQLFDIAIYKKQLAKNLGISRSHPIYFNDKLFLIPLKLLSLDEQMYVNFKEILGIAPVKDSVLIFFKSMRYILVKASIGYIKRQITRCEQINHYLEQVKMQA